MGLTSIRDGRLRSYGGARSRAEGNVLPAPSVQYRSLLGWPRGREAKRGRRGSYQRRSHLALEVGVKSGKLRRRRTQRPSGSGNATVRRRCWRLVLALALALGR